MRQPAHRIIEHGCVIRIHHRLHGGYPGMTAKRFHGAENHRLPTDRAVLLRSACASAKAASCGDEDGGGPLWIGHEAFGYRTVRIWALPLSCWGGENRGIPWTQ